MKTTMAMRIRATVVSAILLLAFTESQAHAYLDPATGSYALQILAAAFFGALFALKMFWTSIKAFVSGLFLRSSDSKPNDD